MNINSLFGNLVVRDMFAPRRKNSLTNGLSFKFTHKQDGLLLTNCTFCLQPKKCSLLEMIILSFTQQVWKKFTTKMRYWYE